MKGLFTSLVIVVCSGIVFANSSPSVNNVTANQRTDGSGIVDIYYTLSDADGDDCTISIEVSDDGGSSYTIVPTSLSGDLTNVSAGRRHIIWNSKTDLPGEYGANYRVKVTADDIGMVWVFINDSGAGMIDIYGNPIDEGGFTGEMSKYETTNAQYCEFLNAALTSGDIIVDANNIYGADGSNTGADFVGELYFDTYEAHLWSQITFNGSTFSVRSRDGYDMSNHPVVLVSWYGATAFCNYYGYRLPTQWEWQAVADYDGSYTYGCGTTIDFSKANYLDTSSSCCQDWANPLNLSSFPYTSPVNHYSSYGYGLNDMAGNLFEWSSTASDSYRIVCGGYFYSGVYTCNVSEWIRYRLNQINPFVGFRVCR